MVSSTGGVVVWLKRLPILLLLCCLLALSPGTCSAYQMTETELTRLEQIFQQLEINNNQLLKDLTESKQDLTTARQKLEEYQVNLEELSKKLVQLKTESAQAKTELETAQNSLEKVNQSLLEYEQEKNKEIKSLKTQRGILLFAAGILAFR